MMPLHLSSYLRSKLIKGILSSMDVLEFREFTLNERFRLQYEKSISTTIGLDDGAGQYVDKLIRLGTISKFIEALYAARNENSDVAGFYQELQQTYENVNQDWQIKKESFQQFLIRKQTLFFIGRTHFSNALARMINGEINDIIVLRGKPGCGASYINYYLLEIEEKYECFKYYYINIDKIRKLYREEIITAAHIAEDVASQLGIEFNMKEFKLQPFKGSLKIKLESIAREEKICLFFFDQFTESRSKEKKLVANDIQEFIDAFVDLVVQNGMSYFVLSGYENYNKEWPKPVRAMSTNIDIDSFTAEQVDNFLDKVYLNPTINFPAKIDKETFFATAKAVLPSTLFEPSAESNVVIIDEKLTDWLEGLMKELKIKGDEE